MRLVKPSVEFLWMTLNPLKRIEEAGRVCYKSESQISGASSIAFIQNLIINRHYAVIEHASASYKVICDRGVTHEIVRHRLFSYCQESTRYCNYKGGVMFVIPPWVDVPKGLIDKEVRWSCGEGQLVSLKIFGHNPPPSTRPSYTQATANWLEHMQDCEDKYVELVTQRGWTPQQARSVLPNSLKTEIVMTANLREWHHFFSLRIAKAAHPQMREIAIPLLEDMKSRVGIIFDGIKPNE